MNPPPPVAATVVDVVEFGPPVDSVGPLLDAVDFLDPAAPLPATVVDAVDF
jgi:hypothetical protein